MSDVRACFPVIVVESALEHTKGVYNMEDKQRVDLYWERSESAIKETEKKYGKYCHYIAYQILENDGDAEEVVNDTYLKTWQTIPPKRPEALKPYVGMICRHRAFDVYEERNTQKRGQIPMVLDELAECLPSEEEDWASEISLRDSLNSFLRGLPLKTRNIFIRRYWYTSSLSEIAEEYSMKESAVGMLLLRTRQKLKTHLQKEGFNV